LYYLSSIVLILFPFKTTSKITTRSHARDTFLLVQHFSARLNVKFLYLIKKPVHVLAGETAADFTPIFYMLGFGLLASVPALILSRLISPRRRYNPVKFLPMECGQMPTGEGRSHFMMQYYAYILMFVVFDVMSIFLYAWGTALFNIPRTATLPIIGFLAIMFTAMGYALYLSGRKGIW
jgi:NADH-quinone oxidoreductase subunit A